MTGASLTAVVVTVSDSVAAGERKDGSGATAEALLAQTFEVGRRVVVPDDHKAIAAVLVDLATSGVDLVITTGGTGFGPRDVTPEATREVIEREAPGLGELLRAEGLKKTPMAALSRGIAGTLKDTLIVNLPGSTKAVTEGLMALQPLLPHALQTLRGDTAHNE